MSLDYDSVHFQSHASPERHPQRVASIAALFGLKPRAFASARVLEIGCGTGLHLLAQANDLPQAEFFGLDLSKEQILKAKAVVLQTGLKNIKFFNEDVRSVKELRGTFDYIICHGMYSWVPEEMRKALLAFLQTHLSTAGIALVSYNALPGWSTRGAVKSLLEQFDDPSLSSAKRIRDARQILQAQLETLDDAAELHEVRLKKELETCLKRSDGFIFHELLNLDCTAFPLSEVVMRAQDHDLSYVGDAQPYRMHRLSLREDMPAIKKEALKNFKDAVHYESFYELHYPQGIRSSLFCRKETQPLQVPDKEKFFELYLSSPLVPVHEPVDVHSEKIITFGTPHQDTIEVAVPIVKAALTVMHRRWPEALQGEELFEFAWGLIGEGVPFQDIRNQFCLGLTKLFAINLVDTYVSPLRVTTELLSRPRTSSLAKYQAEFEQSVTTLRHEVFLPNELQKRLILAADGKNTTENILSAMIAEYRAGNLKVQEDGNDMSDGKEAEKLLAEGVKIGFEQLSEAALLSDTV